ncbi:recombinase RecF [Candidatus Magnetomorum sp. HK-1]|nr:recombinase RecF [Candidatus Magnetomorum sp. HK-1]
MLLKELFNKRMQFYVNKKGGADMHLYLGPKETEQINSTFHIGNFQYKFILESTIDNRFIFNEELLEYQDQVIESRSGHDESILMSSSDERVQKFFHFISKWTHYHFHDTCEKALIRRQHSIRDYENLRSDGRNLAAFLFHLKNSDKDRYDLIRDTTQIVAPFFNDFVLRPKLQSNGDEMIELE